MLVCLKETEIFRLSTGDLKISQMVVTRAFYSVHRVWYALYTRHTIELPHSETNVAVNLCIPNSKHTAVVKILLPGRKKFRELHMLILNSQ